MVQTVKIRKEGNKIKINFMYNNDLIDVMRSHNGYYFKKEKAWIFPAYKQSELYNALTDRHYNVVFVKLQGQKTLKSIKEILWEKVIR